MNKPKEATVEILTSAAEVTAFVEMLAEHSKVADSPENRVRLAQFARDAIYHQVALGWWSRWGITEREHVEGIRITCVMVGGGHSLRFDFSKTKMSRVTG